MRRPLTPSLAALSLLALGGSAGAQELDRYGGGTDYARAAPVESPRAPVAGPARIAYGAPDRPAPLSGGRFLSWSGKSDLAGAPAYAPPPSPPLLRAYASPVQREPVREARREVARVAPAPYAAPPSPTVEQPRPAQPQADARPVLEASREARPPRRPWTEWSRPAAEPAPAAPRQATPAGWAPFDAAAMARGEPSRGKPVKAAPVTGRRTIYDSAPAASPVPAPVARAAPRTAPVQPAPLRTAQAGPGTGSGMRHYSLHREFGMKPDPTPIPPQFFTATADLSGDPAGPDPVVGTGKTAAATRARVAAQSDPS